eukprot:GHRQ01025831.1.p2 GENE.GHRQ01025831.1~~GHRQ01025831.1.p2  ORF type:complete len:128 (+),score=56.73 GHRQ01025831.1:347-730(+)
MSPQLLVWIAAMILQSALLGRNMYAIVCLTDLQDDIINPFDLSTKLNRFVMHEIIAQGCMAGMLLLSGNLLCGACHAAVLGYLLHLHSHRLLHVHTTDAFRQLPQQKKQRIILLAAHLLLFVVVVYR